MMAHFITKKDRFSEYMMKTTFEVSVKNTGSTKIAQLL